MTNTLSPTDDLLGLDDSRFVFSFTWKELLQVVIVGAAIGALTPILSDAIAHFIIEPFFCHNENAFSFCGEGGALAFGIALIMLSIAGLLLLASLRTYQPLINVVAPLAALWGLDQYIQTLADHHTLEFYAISVGLFALAYALFYLLLRIRNFALGLALIVIMVILVRLQF